MSLSQSSLSSLMHITACIVTFCESNKGTHILHHNRGWNFQPIDNMFKFKAQVQLFAKGYMASNP